MMKIRYPVGCIWLHTNQERCCEECFYLALLPNECVGCAQEFDSGKELAAGYHTCNMGRK